MNTFRQHNPSFVDTDNTMSVQEFTTTTDLLAIETVRRCQDLPGFSYYAMAEDLLMAIFYEGSYWFVVGYIKNPTDVELPLWDKDKYQVEFSDESEK